MCSQGEPPLLAQVRGRAQSSQLPTGDPRQEEAAHEPGFSLNSCGLCGQSWIFCVAEQGVDMGKAGERAVELLPATLRGGLMGLNCVLSPPCR